MTLRVLIAVTHLLGAGHLTRAAALARAFAKRGHGTTLVSGGSAVPLPDFGDVSLVQLRPVHTTGTDFRTLLDESAKPIHESRLAARRELLLQTLETVRPDVLITELFPFGRRVLADEFSALLDAARRRTPRPLILCSIRDVLVAPSKPARVAETHERILRDYDAVLVHGDPALVPLDASWPVDERLRPLLRYTGYVDESAAPLPDTSRRGIVVSGGSSAASLPLYRTALEASRNLNDRPWRILVGRGVSDSDFLSLLASAPGHVAVERARPDFRSLLATAELSISQAGYNTVIDILRSGARSLLVPFEAGRETEQRLRAESLASLGLADVLAEENLTPETLTEAVRRGLSQTSPPPPSLLRLDGASESVAIVESLAAAPALHRCIDWTPLAEALNAAEDSGCAIGFWWRDDDAVADTPRLERLLELARRYGAGLALAAIPHCLEPSLAGSLAREENAFALVHGWSHANHAPEGVKKAEFGPHRSLAAMERQAEESLRAARTALGGKLLPVFVPPWNRIAPDLVPLLPDLGYIGLSTFRDRDRHAPVKKLVQINTHVDPVDWHGTRSLAAPETIVAGIAAAVGRRVAGEADPDEPVGFLTHHLMHDEAIWSFCERLAMFLAERDIRFLRIQELFRNESRIAVQK